MPLAAVAGAMVLVAIFIGLWAVLSPLKEGATPEPRTTAVDDTATAPVEPSLGATTEDETKGAADAAPAEASYTVEASPMRHVPDRGPQRLQPGETVAIGDYLTLEFRASRSLHVYVINEDEQGKAYALFPLPDLSLQNPLAADTTHELPGMMEGRRITWEVTSAGGRERLLIVASPERLIEFEAEMAKLARPGAGQSALQLSSQARRRLRGIGGLAEVETPEPTGSAGKLFEIAGRLESSREIVAGAWVRQIEFENPNPEP